MGQSLERLVYHVSTLSLSPSPSLSFSGRIPIYSMEAHDFYLLAVYSKTHVRESLVSIRVRAADAA